MTAGKPEKKGLNVLGAITDFLILVLLVGAAGGAGYYYGTLQKFAPLQAVGPGTPGALPAESSKLPAKNAETASTATPPATPVTPAETTTTKPKTPPATATSTAKADATTKKAGKTKYWICSSGTDYIGYQITVSVNGTPLDSFYGPDKILKITDHLKPGPNTVLFDARMVGDKFNKHKGDDKAELVLKLVKGETVQDTFPESDVLATFTRNASETDDYKDSQHIEKAE